MWSDNSIEDDSSDDDHEDNTNATPIMDKTNETIEFHAPMNTDPITKQQTSINTDIPAPTNTDTASETTTVDPTAHLPPPDSATKKALRSLFIRIQDSSDKLFFICDLRSSAQPPKWRLAQADLLYTDPQAARNFGLYYVRWHRPSPEDLISKRDTWECRFWPNIYTCDANNKVIQPNPVKPNKANQVLKNNDTITWRSNTIFLPEDLLVCPFDFTQR